MIITKSDWIIFAQHELGVFLNFGDVLRRMGLASATDMVGKFFNSGQCCLALIDNAPECRCYFCLLDVGYCLVLETALALAPAISAR